MVPEPYGHAEDASRPSSPPTYPAAMPDGAALDLPRGVRLALWGSAFLARETDLPSVLRAVQRDDETHTVSGVTSAGDLAELLPDLAASGATALRVVLPAPGDPFGLAGPADFTVEATDAGEAVLVEGGPVPLGLVPHVTEFGSVLEPGAIVDWRVSQVQPPRPLAESLGDADRSLREATRSATEALAGLDVSRWREDAAERISGVRDGRLPADAVPHRFDARAARVLTSAARVRAIAALALEDDGAAVTGWEAAERARSLREVDAVARRSLAIAANVEAPEARSFR